MAPRERPEDPALDIYGHLLEALSGHAPGRDAAERYGALLALCRGVDEETLAARERARDGRGVPGGRAEGPEGQTLPVSSRLYCAELSVLLLGLVEVAWRASGAGVASKEGWTVQDGEAVAGWVLRTLRQELSSVGPLLGGLAPGQLVSWLTDPPDGLLGVLVAAAVSAEAVCPAGGRREEGSVRADPFEDVAQRRLGRLLPAVIRHDLGIHFTPGWAAREVVCRAMKHGGAGPRTQVSDPACGTGVFLLETLRWKWHAALRIKGQGLWELVRSITGVEASPLVACIARLSLVGAALAVAGEPPSMPSAPGGPCAAAPGPVRVLSGDVLCDLQEVDGSLWLGSSGDALPLAQVLVGNPPWVAWDALPAGYKDRLAQGILREYDLFDLRGFEARLGGANDDLSVAFTLVALDRLLEPGGSLAFLLKLNLLTNESARTFRRFRVTRQAGDGPGRPFSVDLLCDLRGANPFAASVEPALLILSRDRQMGDRIPSERWKRVRGGDLEVTAQEDYTPVWSGGGRGGPGPWAPGSNRRRGSAGLAGDLPYDVRHGLKHDCNAVFLLELQRSCGNDLVQVRNRPETARRIDAPRFAGALERRYLRPLLQSRHVRPLAITGWAHALVPATAEGVVAPQSLATGAPATLDYLQQMRRVLATRRSRVFDRPPFYRVFAVGPYNWAPCLVVWCGMGMRPWFAVVDEVLDPLLGSVRPIPDGSCYLVALDDRPEACYLAGLLNSTPVRDYLVSRSSGSKRGLSRAVVSRLGLPRYDPTLEEHRALARVTDSLCRVGSEPVPDAQMAAVLDPVARRVLG